jgi:hypothetical protein
MQYKQQSAMYKAQSKQQEAFNKAKDAEAVRQYGEMSIAETDERDNDARSTLDIKRQHIQDVGALRAQQAASGNSGGSLDLMMQDLRSSGGRDMSNIMHNRRVQGHEMLRQSSSIRHGLNSQKDTRILTKPSKTAATLRTGAKAAQAYVQGGGFS